MEKFDEEYSVLKMSLKSFIKNDIILEPLELIIYDINKVVFEGYNLANYHIIRLLNEKKYKHINPDQVFFQRCLTAVGNSHSTLKDLELQKSLDFYEKFRPSNYNVANTKYISSGIIHHFSQQMETNTLNFIEINFYKFFFKYIKYKYKKENNEVYKIINSIYEVCYDKDDEIVLKYRKIVEGIISKTLDRYEDWYKKPMLVLPILFIILKYNEEVHYHCLENKVFIDRGVRLFNIIPNKKNYTMSNIKLYNAGLYGLLKRIDIYYSDNIEKQTEFRKMIKDSIKMDLDELNQEKIKKFHNEIWKMLFDIEGIEKVNNKFFKNEILTDGKAVSITLFKKIPKVLKPKVKSKALDKENELKKIHTLKIENYDNIIGLDPGVTSIYVATSDKQTFKSKSTKDYYHKSKFNETEKTEKNWVNKNDEIKNIILHLPSNKTTSLVKYEYYIGQSLKSLDKLLTFYGAFRFRNNKFKRYIYSQKELHKMCIDLIGNIDKKTLVGFGNWGNDSKIIRKKIGPVIKFKNTLKNYCEVVDVDEFKTSRIHNDCKCDTLTNQYSEVYKNEQVDLKKIHSILYCTNPNCKGKTMNRDENASKNILDVLVNQIENKQRLEAFKR